MDNIIFVTGNDNKAREAAQILGRPIAREKIELDELQSMDLRVIVEHKVRQAYEILNGSAKNGKAVMVEDVSLEIKKWNGFPGPFIKWVHERMGYDEFCAILGEDRRADWRVMYGYYDGTKLVVADATVSGAIAAEPRVGGWGFDVMFIPVGQTKTLGELGPEQKIPYSARAKALSALRDLLLSN
jgi:non-canonical purine NTP pyrophosphatase (RdgB/HAM1 family)